MSIFRAFGDLGSQGIVIIFQAKATTNPAQAETLKSVIFIKKSFGLQRRLRSSESETGVLAIQTGKSQNQSFSRFFIDSSAFWEYFTQLHQ